MPKLPLSSSARTTTTFGSSMTTAVGVVISSLMKNCLSVQSIFLFPRFVDCTNHVERTLRPLVAGAIENRPAAPESVNQRHRSPGLTGEGLRDREGLREESLQPASPRRNEAIASAQFLNPKKRDDVLQFLVMRDRLAYLLGNAVVLLTDD